MLHSVSAVLLVVRWFGSVGIVRESAETTLTLNTRKKKHRKSAHQADAVTLSVIKTCFL